jgi:hypothetical protein
MSGCCCDGQSDPTVSEGLANEEVTVDDRWNVGVGVTPGLLAASRQV